MPFQDEHLAESATELAGLAAKLADGPTPGSSAPIGLGPLTAYREGLEEGLLRRDSRQESTILELQRLYEDLLAVYPSRSSRGKSGLTLLDAAHSAAVAESDSGKRPWWRTLFGSNKDDYSYFNDENNETVDPIVRGLYMYGGVGCGKTMLMDLFVASAPKQFQLERTHFHDFMLDVHSRLRMHQSTQDPLALVADQLVAKTRVLCLDELFVTDIADAMILHRLFDRLWDKGLVLVATSNRAPDALYEGGLQRALFMPFIARLKRACRIHDMASPTDYRRLAQHRSGLYFTSSHREHELWDRFIELTNNREVGPEWVEVAMGRQLELPRVGGCIAFFTFDELCNKPLGAADYIALANAKHTVAIGGIPVFTGGNRSAAYRFVTLIDVLYEHRVRVLCSAEAAPAALFANIKPHAEANAELDSGDVVSVRFASPRLIGYMPG